MYLLPSSVRFNCKYRSLIRRKSHRLNRWISKVFNYDIEPYSFFFFVFHSRKMIIPRSPRVAFEPRAGVFLPLSATSTRTECTLWSQRPVHLNRWHVPNTHSGKGGGYPRESFKRTLGRRTLRRRKALCNWGWQERWLAVVSHKETEGGRREVEVAATPVSISSTWGPRRGDAGLAYIVNERRGVRVRARVRGWEGTGERERRSYVENTRRTI